MEGQCFPNEEAELLMWARTYMKTEAFGEELGALPGTPKHPQ